MSDRRALLVEAVLLALCACMLGVAVGLGVRALALGAPYPGVR